MSDTIELKFNGTVIFSGEVNVGETPNPNPNPEPQPNPTPQPQPSGAYGSKTNPIKLNKLSGQMSGYISQDSPDDGWGTVNLPSRTTLWFEVDPLEITGRSVAYFGVNSKFYNSAFSVIKCTQNKVTGEYSAETSKPPRGFRDIVYDGAPWEIDDYKFLYGIDNSAGSSFDTIDVWAIM